MAAERPTLPTSSAIRDLLVEAGTAVLDKGRTLSSAAVPASIKAVLTNLTVPLPALIDVEVIKGKGGAALGSVWDGVSSVGRTGANGLNKRLSWLGAQAGEVVRSGGEILKGHRGRSPAETEALLQEVLRKHDALIREVHDRNAASAERMTYLHGLLVRLEDAMGGLTDPQSAGPEHLAVMTAQRRRLEAERQGADQITSATEHAIERATALLSSAKELGLPTGATVPVLRSWDDMVAEARADCSERPVTFDGLLTEQELQDALSRVADWREEFANLHRLAAADYVVAGVAGVLAALADIFLVQVPHHPGFFGTGGAEGGWLSNLVKDGFGQMLPPDTIRSLERAYAVPYDAATSASLDVAVAGLGPRTHRLHSLGHDPVLGWIFGVRDVLAGGFTAIGADGTITIQDIAGWKPSDVGAVVFGGLTKAFGTVAGHMLSDVATSAGLPPPLFGAMQLLQQKLVGDHSIAEITRAMYRNGYDFRHFLAGGACAAIVEVVVRVSAMARSLQQGRPLADSMPIGSDPRLRTTLFVAHGVAAAVNAGKVTVTGNPLAVNYAQWLAFFRYLMPQLRWMLVERRQQEGAFVGAKLDREWRSLDRDLAERWTRAFGAAPRATI